MRVHVPGRGESERGSVLLMVLVLSVVMAGLLAGAVSTAVLQSKSVQHSTNSLEAQGLAEGATDIAQKELIETVANFQPPPTSGALKIGNHRVDWTANPIGPTAVRFDVDGIRMTAQPYDISSTVEIDTGTANVTRVIDLTLTPVFQYMIFFDDDLEILPGPDMIIEGRVHANGDVYIGSGGTLTVDTDYFKTTGEILRRRKDDGSTTGGTVLMKEYQTTTLQALDPGADSSSPGWTQNALTTWGGSVQTGDHEVRKVAAPELHTLQPGGFYDNAAGLRIVDGQAYNNFGTPVLLPVGTITEKKMFDGREGKSVTVTEVNVALLNASGAFPTNGLIYARRTDASAAQPNGIRLTNGAELAAPLTLVSENPVYVKGDFNTVNKKGASVIADAVNLLSNAWNDSKSAGSLPVASDTTYNLAMVTGNVRTPDGGGAYSGGFENLPRFHENWSGRTATIRGSFVNLYESSMATAPWRYGGDVYTAPARDWRFDQDLLDPGLLPPFTPSAVYVRRVLWDDNKPVSFKIADNRITLLPNVPTYDPWNYDATFMTKVMLDPNTK